MAYLQDYKAGNKCKNTDPLVNMYRLNPGHEYRTLENTATVTKNCLIVKFKWGGSVFPVTP